MLGVLFEKKNVRLKLYNIIFVMEQSHCVFFVQAISESCHLLLQVNLFEIVYCEILIIHLKYTK